MPDNSLFPTDPAGEPRLLQARAHVVDALAHLELVNGVVQLLQPLPIYAPMVTGSVEAIAAGVRRLDAAISQARRMDASSIVDGSRDPSRAR